MMPAYATRLLVPHESISYVTRPRAVSLGMLLALGAILLALAVFSAIVDPGSIRLLPDSRMVR
jgi:type II secretory pathway component PulM